MSVDKPMPDEETLEEWCEDALTMGVELDEMSIEYQETYAKFLKKKGRLQ